jgi:retron-type reverse transcriptase
MKQGSTRLISKTPRPSPDSSKYRPISLLCVLTRMFYKAVDTKLRRLSYEMNLINDNQAGFMPNKSTHRQVMNILCMQAIFRHQKQSLFIAFLDIEKAFDTIPHETLLQVMQELGLPLEWVEAIRLILIGNSTKILNTKINITRGCLQGSPLSPLLCLFILEDLTRYLLNQFDPEVYSNITAYARQRTH